MASKILAMSLGGALLGSFLEKRFLTKTAPFLYESSDVLPGLPRAYGFVIGILTVFSLWLTIYGTMVSRVRTTFRTKAEKDGEDDLDRYSIPNLYVNGTSKHATAFNCTQRSHQHVLESICQFYCSALFGALGFPVTVAISTLLWAYARVVFAKSYAKDGFSGRYSHSLSRFIWMSLLANFALSGVVAVNFVIGAMY